MEFITSERSDPFECESNSNPELHFVVESRIPFSISGFERISRDDCHVTGQMALAKPGVTCYVGIDV